MQHTSKQVRSGFIWSGLDSFGNKGLAFLISIFLARHLGPTAFGLVALLTIFIAVANVFVDGGFNSALIRKLDRNENDYSTVFYISLATSLIMYGVVYFIAPFIAAFYIQPQLENLLKILGLVLIIQPFSLIPKTKLSILLDFKKQAQANMVALISSGSISLYLVYNDYGVWSLIYQQLTYVLIGAIMINVLMPWKPSEKFSSVSFKTLFSFGSNILFARLIDTIYNNIYGLVIGKQFNSSQLAIFTQAMNLSMLPASTFTQIMQKVTYPLLSEIQEDSKALESNYFKMIKGCSIVVFPVMAGICIISEPLINILLGTEWEESATLLSVLCFSFMLFPVQAINLNLLQVKGRSDLFLRLEIVKKINLTVMLLVTVPLGVYEICIGIVITSYIALIMNTYLTSKELGVSFLSQFSILLPTFLITLFSSFVGLVVGGEIINEIMEIIIVLSVSLVTYLTLTFCIQRVYLKEVCLIFRGKL